MRASRSIAAQQALRASPGRQPVRSMKVNAAAGVDSWRSWRRASPSRPSAAMSSAWPRRSSWWRSWPWAGFGISRGHQPQRAGQRPRLRADGQEAVGLVGTAAQLAVDLLEVFPADVGDLTGADLPRERYRALGANGLAGAAAAEPAGAFAASVMADPALGSNQMRIGNGLRDHQDRFAGEDELLGGFLLHDGRSLGGLTTTATSRRVAPLYGQCAQRTVARQATPVG